MFRVVVDVGEGSGGVYQILIMIKRDTYRISFLNYCEKKSGRGKNTATNFLHILISKESMYIVSKRTS